MPAEPEDVLEADEMWSFVYERWNKRWVWTVMCRRTRQIVAFVIGDRSEAACRKLWEQIPPTYRVCQSYSDFWEAYQLVFPEETHECVGKGSGQRPLRKAQKTHFLCGLCGLPHQIPENPNYLTTTLFLCEGN